MPTRRFLREALMPLCPHYSKHYRGNEQVGHLSAGCARPVIRVALARESEGSGPFCATSRRRKTAIPVEVLRHTLGKLLPRRVPPRSHVPFSPHSSTTRESRARSATMISSQSGARLSHTCSSWPIDAISRMVRSTRMLRLSSGRRASVGERPDTARQKAHVVALPARACPSESRTGR